MRTSNAAGDDLSRGASLDSRELWPEEYMLVQVFAPQTAVECTSLYPIPLPRRTVFSHGIVAELPGERAPAPRCFSATLFNDRELVHPYASALLDLHRTHFGNAPFVDKSPGVEAVAAAPLLQEILPAARFINMKRRDIEKWTTSLSSRKARAGASRMSIFSELFRMSNTSSLGPMTAAVTDSMATSAKA